jgi:hypothetical protein
VYGGTRVLPVFGAVKEKLHAIDIRPLRRIISGTSRCFFDRCLVELEVANGENVAGFVDNKAGRRGDEHIRPRTSCSSMPVEQHSKINAGKYYYLEFFSGIMVLGTSWIVGSCNWRDSFRSRNRIQQIQQARR